MARHLKSFLWFVYGAVAIQFMEAIFAQKSWDAIGATTVGAIIIVVLAFAAARDGYKFAAWLLVLFVLAHIAGTVAMFWASGPSWLQALGPDQPVTGLVKAMDVVTNLFEIAALWCYFSGETRQAASGHSIR
jgi:hypothetical protein